MKAFPFVVTPRSGSKKKEIKGVYNEFDNNKLLIMFDNNFKIERELSKEIQNPLSYIAKNIFQRYKDAYGKVKNLNTNEIENIKTSAQVKKEKEEEMIRTHDVFYKTRFGQSFTEEVVNSTVIDANGEPVVLKDVLGQLKTIYVPKNGHTNSPILNTILRYNVVDVSVEGKNVDILNNAISDLKEYAKTKDEFYLVLERWERNSRKAYYIIDEFKKFNNGAVVWKIKASFFE